MYNAQSNLSIGATFCFSCYHGRVLVGIVNWTVFDLVIIGKMREFLAKGADVGS